MELRSGKFIGDKDDAECYKVKILSEICLRKKRGNSFRLTSLEIIKIIQLYSEWITFVKDYDLKRNFFHDIFRFLLKSMFWSHFEEGEYVKIFLNYLHESGEKLLCETVLPVNIFSYMPYFMECPKMVEFQEYFLRHAYKYKMLFNGYRLPCRTESFPLMHVVKNGLEPSLFHQMLRYGALLSYEKYHDQFFYDFVNSEYSLLKDHFHVVNRRNNLLHLDSVFPLLIIAAPLLFILRYNPDLLKRDDFISLEKSANPNNFDEFRCVLLPRYDNVISCWNMMLLDFGQWTLIFVKMLKFVKNNNMMFDLRHIRTNDFIERLICNILPNFENHILLSLKQACRLCIRRRLNDNWLLPRGIYTLDIPYTLKQYLDLNCD